MGFDQNLIWSAMALCATIIGESPLLYIVGDDIGVCIALRFLCLCCLSSSKHKLFGMWATNLIVHCNPIWSMFKPPCMANPNWVNWMHRVVGMRVVEKSQRHQGKHLEIPSFRNISSIICLDPTHHNVGYYMF